MIADQLAEKLDAAELQFEDTTGGTVTSFVVPYSWMSELLSEMDELGDGRGGPNWVVRMQSANAVEFRYKKKLLVFALVNEPVGGTVHV